MFRIKTVVAAASIAAAALTSTTLASAGPQARKDVKLSLDFETSGRVTAVLVQPGEHVRRGQTLARVEGTEPQAALSQATASLKSAQAQVDQLKAGMTPAEIAEADLALAQAQAAIVAATKADNDILAAGRADDAALQAAVDQATVALVNTGARVAQSAKTRQLAVDQATAALANPRARVAQSAKTRQLAVDQATAALANARQHQASDRKTLDEAKAKLAKDQTNYDQQGCANTPNNPGCQSLAQTIDQDKQAVSAADQSLAASTAQTAADADALAMAQRNNEAGRVDDERTEQDAGAQLANAQRNNEAGKIDDERTEQDARAQLANAQLNKAKGAVQAQTSIDQAGANLRNALLGKQSAKVSSDAKHPAPKVSELAAANAAMISAHSAVSTAEYNLAKTELRAPADGVIVTVSHHVGELSAIGGGSAQGSSGFITMITFEDQ
jgi:multidrug resistance efflux pump